MNYKHIYIPVDNSEHSNCAVEWGLALARALGAKVTGSHVYAAKLHDVRFKQMEFTLPEEYQEEKELEHQRKIHDSLIAMGLRLISDSYLDWVEKKAEALGVPFSRKIIDGKNWEALVEDIRSCDYDLVVMGALGTGAVKHSQLGSVCERVLRRVQRDVLVIKDTRALPEQTGPVAVGVDGSPQSFAAVQTALQLAKTFQAECAAVSVYDPYLHYTVFNGIVDVLSEKASKIFRFKDQEQLHEDIIDTGLAKIYQSHLEVASQIARESAEVIPFRTRLMDGKAFEKVYQFIEKEKPRLLVTGRIGIHSKEEMDIGSNAENLLRLAPCNMLLISRKHVPPIDVKAEAAIVWTQEATARFRRVPESVRKIARTAVHRYAMERGHSIITNSILNEVMEIFMPKSSQKMQELAVEVAKTKLNQARTQEPVYICSQCGKVTPGIRPAVCSVCQSPGEKSHPISKKDLRELARKEGPLTEEETFDGQRIQWTLEARKKISAIRDGYARRRTRAQVEKASRIRRLPAIDVELVEEMLGRVEKEKDSAIWATPPVSIENELASPLPVPEKWEKAEPPISGKPTFRFPWTEQALARLARVPEGFMRDNSRLKIEEYAQEKQAPAITLEVAEAGLARARKLMEEMIASYSQGKK